MNKLAIIICLLFLNSCSWLQPKYKSGVEGNPLPHIELVLKDSQTLFNTASIPSGKPFIVFLYSTNCPYCQAQTKEILEHISAIKKNVVYMISADSYFLIQNFSKTYRLDKYPNIILARDSSEQLMDYFKAPGVPYIAFYDKEGKLKQVVLGNTSFSKISDILVN